MQPVHVNVYIHAPIEEVFDAVTDHEGYARYPGILSAKLVQPGRTERNGAGAVREIRTPGVRFVEEITGFERPVRMEYVIRECTLPIRHEGGSIELVRRGDGTEVNWISRVQPALPIGGGLLSRVARPITVEAFTTFLLAMKKRLESRRAESARAARAPN